MLEVLIRKLIIFAAGENRAWENRTIKNQAGGPRLCLEIIIKLGYCREKTFPAFEKKHKKHIREDYFADDMLGHLGLCFLCSVLVTRIPILGRFVPFAESVLP